MRARPPANLPAPEVIAGGGALLVMKSTAVPIGIRETRKGPKKLAPRDRKAMRKLNSAPKQCSYRTPGSGPPGLVQRAGNQIGHGQETRGRQNRVSSAADNQSRPTQRERGTHEMPLRGNRREQQ